MKRIMSTLGTLALALSIGAPAFAAGARPQTTAKTTMAKSTAKGKTATKKSSKTAHKAASKSSKTVAPATK